MKHKFRVSLKNSKKKEKELKNTSHSCASAFFKRKKDVSCSGYPGRGGENSRVQNRHGRVKRSGALSFTFSFFLCASFDSCRGDAFFLFSKNFSRFSLSLGISQQKFFGVCRFENFLSRVSKKMKHKTDRNPLRGFFFFFTNTPLPLDHDRFSSLMALTMRFGAFSF